MILFFDNILHDFNHVGKKFQAKAKKTLKKQKSF